MIIDVRYVLEKCGDFYEVFDNEKKITVLATEDRSVAINTRNWLNGTTANVSIIPVELIAPVE